MSNLAERLRRWNEYFTADTAQFFQGLAADLIAAAEDIERLDKLEKYGKWVERSLVWADSDPLEFEHRWEICVRMPNRARIDGKFASAREAIDAIGDESE